MKLIKMMRDEPMFPDGPVSAEVPESEVTNWQAVDWRVAESEIEIEPEPEPEIEKRKAGRPKSK